MMPPDSESQLHRDLVIRSERDRHHQRRQEKRYEKIAIVIGSLMAIVIGALYWLRVTGRL
jgi:hypothetical protein